MHVQLPRFHVHPALGLIDTAVMVGSALAVFRLDVIDATISQITSIVIQLAGLTVGATLLVIRLKSFGSAIVGNTEQIEALKAEAAEAKAKALKAHALARSTVNEAAAARAESSAVIEDLKAQLRVVCHGVRDVQNEVQFERKAREKLGTTPDPDKPLIVEIHQPEGHPVPTMEVAPDKPAAAETRPADA